jgi:chemotaxis protein CheY-P-specific phosphatase CheC
MLPGLTSYTTEQEDEAFMEFGPQLITGIAERLSKLTELKTSNA